eukprot:386732-Alexandrium_andersonii.AAC.1
MVDLIGPTKPDLNDCIYLLVTRDEYSGLPKIHPLKTKESSEVADAFSELYAGQSVRAVRSDNGG